MLDERLDVCQGTDMTNTNPGPQEAHAMHTTLIPDAQIVWSDADKYAPGHYSVEPIWTGVDRPNTGGWSVSTNEALGQRLVRAIRAGVVCLNPVIKTDVNGATYVSHDGHLRVSGRRMNSDLKKLGF